MKIKAIKQGKTLQLKENLNLPDGQEIMIFIAEDDLIDSQYQLAHQKLIEEIKIDSLESLETEEDIIKLAIKLTS